MVIWLNKLASIDLPETPPAKGDSGAPAGAADALQEVDREQPYLLERVGDILAHWPNEVRQLIHQETTCDFYLGYRKD